MLIKSVVRVKEHDSVVPSMNNAFRRMCTLKVFLSLCQVIEKLSNQLPCCAKISMNQYKSVYGIMGRKKAAGASELIMDSILMVVDWPFGVCSSWVFKILT